MSKIYIDPGHGGRDPGAVKYVRERDVAVKVAEYMQDYLVQYDCETRITTGTDSTVARAKKANTWRADLFVSIHFNAGGGDGYEALVYSAENKDLGKVFEEYVKATGQNSRGVKYRPELNVLKYTKMPAILNEIAFVDNKKDIKDWDEDAELKTMGAALAAAAAEYLDLHKESETGVYKILVSSLNVRSGPGTEHKKVTQVKKGEAFTITEISGNWGKLKSGKGWINISSKYCKRM